MTEKQLPEVGKTVNGVVDVVLCHGTVLGGHREASESVQAMKLVVHGDRVERATGLVGLFRGRVQQDETVVWNDRAPVILVVHWMEVVMRPLNADTDREGINIPPYRSESSTVIATVWTSIGRNFGSPVTSLSTGTRERSTRQQDVKITYERGGEHHIQGIWR